MSRARLRIIGLLALLGATTLVAGCSTFPAHVTEITGPASFRALPEEGDPVEVRVKGIVVRDPDGSAAALHELVAGRDVTLRIGWFAGRDDAGRVPALVIAEGRNVGRVLVDAGFARREPTVWSVSGEGTETGVKLVQSSPVFIVLAGLLYGPLLLSL